MFLQWCSSGHKMTLLKVTTLILLSLFLMPKHSKGQIQGSLVMDPNEDDLVLEKGVTLNLTCTYTIDFTFGLNISWKLPDQLVQNKLVRNICCLLFVKKMHFFLSKRS